VIGSGAEKMVITEFVAEHLLAEPNSNGAAID